MKRVLLALASRLPTPSGSEPLPGISLGSPRAQEDLHDVQQIFRSNIEEILGRGERLESVLTARGGASCGKKEEGRKGGGSVAEVTDPYSLLTILFEGFTLILCLHNPSPGIFKSRPIIFSLGKLPLCSPPLLDSF